MDVVERVLQEEAEKESLLKTTDVTKAIDVELDLGNLLAVDCNPLEVNFSRSKVDKRLESLTRDNTQLLFNEIFALKAEKLENAVVVTLPDQKTIIPREKPVPKEKPASKWSEYAKLKGIQKRKKSRMVWDDKSKEWRPRWGYKRGNDETKQWAIEVPQNADPYEDQFEKINKAKKERVAKNELQRLRNVARNFQGRI